MTELFSVMGPLQVILATIGIVFVNLFFNYLHNKNEARKLGCRPPALLRQDYCFGFRNLLSYLKLKNEGKLVDLSRKRFELGDGNEVDTYDIRFAGTVNTFTRDPENIKAILATQFNDFALGSTRYTAFFPLLGDGIFTLDGAGWKHSRALLKPQFARVKIGRVRAMDPHIERLAKHIRLHKGEKFDIQELFFKLTVDFATEFLFGESVETLKDVAIGDSHDLEVFDGKAGFADAISFSEAYITTRSRINSFQFLFNSKKFKENNAVIHKFSDHYVNEALTKDSNELDKEEDHIFLYELVKKTRDPKVLRDQLLNILLAGRNTTAGFLTFTFYELARNPPVWEKLKAELYNAFGSGEDSNINEITFESLKRCGYLKAVLNEVLRVYPVVPMDARASVKSTSLPKGGGPDGSSPVYVPKGATVYYSIYAAHRNKKIYGKDADEFIPERWFEPSVAKLGWNYLPFNGGPRICLGQQFALTEASYVVTRLAQMFPNLKSRDNGPYPPLKDAQLTMSLKNGAWIELW